MFFFRRHSSAAMHKSSRTYRHDTIKSKMMIAPHKSPHKNGLLFLHRRFHILHHRLSVYHQYTKRAAKV